jgi:hypothetical protein
MSGGGGPCFDLSGFLALPQSTQFLYRGYWNTFNRIQVYNINVSTLKAQGTPGLFYYQYANFTERSQYTNGRMLHIRRYPSSNWDPVLET